MAKKFSGFSTNITPDKTSTSQFIVGYSGQDNARWTMKALADEIGGGDNIYTIDGTINEDRTISIPGDTSSANSSNLKFDFSNTNNAQYGGYMNSTGTTWSTGWYVPVFKASVNYYNNANQEAAVYIKPRFGNGITGFAINMNDDTLSRKGIEYYHQGDFHVLNNLTSNTGKITLSVNASSNQNVGIRSERYSYQNWSLYDFTNASRIIDMAQDGSGKVGIGTNTTANLSARLNIKGAGLTNATHALKVQDSGGTDLLSIADDGNVKLGKYSSGVWPFASDGADTQVTFAKTGKFEFNNSAGGNYIEIAGSGNGFRMAFKSGGFQYLNYNSNGGQMGIGSTGGSGTSPQIVPSAQLAVTSSTRGFLPPAMTNTERDAISSPADGLMVYSETDNKIQFYNGTAWTDAGGSGGGSIYTADGDIPTGTNREVTLTGTSTLFFRNVKNQGDFRIGGDDNAALPQSNYSIAQVGSTVTHYSYQSAFNAGSNSDPSHANFGPGANWLYVSAQGLEHHKVSVGVGINGTVNDRLVVKGQGQTTSKYTARFLDGADNDILTIRDDRLVKITSPSGLTISSGSGGYGGTTLTPYSPSNSTGFTINNGNVNFTVGNNGCIVGANSAANAKLRIGGTGTFGVNGPNLYVVTDANSSGTEAVVIENSDGTDLLNMKENGRTSFSSQVSVGLKSSATIDGIDWDNGNIQEVTLASSDTDFDPTNEVPGSTYILKITQPAAGDGTINWEGTSATVNWPGGTAPTLTATNAAVDIITLVCTAANTYYGTSALNFS